MADPGTVSKVLAYSLFIIAGLIMVPTTLLMIGKKTDPRPDRPTTTVVTEGFFRYSRNPVVPLAHSDLRRDRNSCEFIVARIPAPSLVRFSERGVVLREEKYLEGKFWG